MASGKDISSTLVDAAKDGHVEPFRTMLEAGADVNAQAYSTDSDSQGSHALITAAVNGNIEVVQLLLDYGATVDKINRHPLLNKPDRRADIDLLRLLVERGADPETSGFEDYLQALPGITTEMMMPRSWHMVEELLPVVRLMIDNGYDMHAYDRLGHSPLLYATCEPHDRLFDLLMEKGANVNFCRGNSEAGVSVLSRAAESATPEKVRRLLDNGAEITRGSSHPLISAAGRGRLDNMFLLIEKGASIQALDTDGRTALHEAAKNGKRDPIRLLVGEGIPLEVKSAKTGMTPLHEAAASGHLSAVKDLLCHGANVNAVDDNGESVMHHALFELNKQMKVCGHCGAKRRPDKPRVEMLRYLLSKGGDSAVLDSSGRSLLHRAIQSYACKAHGSKGPGTLEEVFDRCPAAGSEAAQLLLALGLDVNAQDNNGDTPLHYAAHHQNVAIIQLLLEAGANIEARNHEGATPPFETVKLKTVDENGHESSRAYNPVSDSLEGM